MTTMPWGEYMQNAAEAGFTILPAGWYDMVVKEAEAGKTGTGKHKVKVRFMVENGPQQGMLIFNDFVISPESGIALGFFFRHMEALGIGKETFTDDYLTKHLAADLVGGRAQVQVVEDLYNGTKRAKVKDVKAPSDGVIGKDALSGGAPVPNWETAAPSAPVPSPQAEPLDFTGMELPPEPPF